ncbi:SusC/RagA family TonB-linked outer membrane protein [Kaistella palustris]|uniref:SusC/RagA family TonB-linked outer membrane protein n=1 Tax=Kaistella palustris TaxID=493376 RepID=UPI0003FBB911|nr:SusC/RagA family TonB-linked outer membrane protein [Kaistella palustris]
MKKKFCRPAGLTFAFLLSAAYCTVHAQTRTVTGTVNDGEKPLSGVVVSQSGTSQATTTNSAGAFRLEITGENPILVFRHPEYTEGKIVTDGKSHFAISLKGKESAIQEVTLNAGYYEVKAKESTGSISRVTAKDIENQPVSNVLAAVQGRMAGVSITQNGGVPGGGYQVQIRGRNSLRTIANSGTDGNQPLYVVDGIVIGMDTPTKYSATALPLGSISPLNSINPNDIETFEILKDADATAIYGSRGANGVVLITTKKGKSGKTSLSFTANYGISKALNNLKMMNTAQYLQMRRQAYTNSGVTTFPANAYDVNGTWDPTRNTDWPEELLGNSATMTEVRTSVSGGSELTRFRISVGHTEQTTPFGNGFRYTANTLSNSVTHHSRDQRLQLSMANNIALLKNNAVGTDITRQAFLLPPNAPELYGADGSLNWANGTFTNPVAAFKGNYTNENKQFMTNLTASFELLRNITVKLNGGITYQDFEEWSFQPNTLYNPATAQGLNSSTSRASKSDQNRFSYVVEPQVSWTFIRDRHRLTALAGATVQQDQLGQGYMTGTGFESNALISNIAAAKTKTVGDQLTTEYRYAAVFGRVNYRYNGRYLLNLTGRRDGSSRFGPNNRFADFGAVGAAWIFSEENFVKDLKWLSTGKLRGSYGLTGSDHIGDYQYHDTYTVSNMIYNGVTGLVPSRLFNPDYSWEKTRKLEAALELGMFANRLSLTTSWYRNRSSSQLVGYQLPTVTGFSSVLANLAADVENTGVEVEVGYHSFKGRTMQWETAFNMSIPKNKLLSFPGLEGSTYSNTYVIGMPVTIVKLYNLEGIDAATGKYIFTDYNGDGKISAPDDNKVIEDLGVRFFGGWSNRLSYRNWDLSFLVQFVKQRNRNFNNSIPSPGLMNNLPVQALDVWSPQNPGGLYMPYQSTANPLHPYFQNSTASVGDASFLRLKNVQLGYDVPVRGTFFTNARIYVQGQNLLTVTKYFGYDPENPLTSFLPPLKTWSFGLLCNF